ncbi:phage baseplate assembly protein domain-containing protein [Commensalibacter oyaizuii]|uniref:Phage baseplate assembly protein n=1 Tax=Commensalibacter oyaizuii TaxID=3043873 RepID=A0ABT6Q507_9PROT|nr:phage baseplate assembly protein [Commensalibacter sp. TBRC 16381]MDI2091631.1 phage baseplate assembly protein [Commensalibacter sp. TBRC 16381]
MTEALRKMATRLHMAMGIGRVTKGITHDQNTPLVQVTFAVNEVRDHLPVLQQYGFASRPLLGADVVVQFQSGDRNKGVVIASGDQRYYPKNLKDGEVAIYHKTGSMIILKEDGSIELTPQNNKITLNADVQVTGKITANNMVATDDVKAGSVSLKSHVHSNGHNGGLTGGPSS